MLATLAALALLAYSHKQVLVVILTSAMLVLAQVAMSVDKLEVGFAFTLAFGVFMLCLVAMAAPEDCTGALGQYTPTDESMDEFFVFYAKLKSFSLIL
jgi:hypothetical protein